jgi:oxaloacetate decarboxylase gamma subunit
MLHIFDFLVGRIMNEMLSSGVEIMLIGMGIVYTFLAVLVMAIGLMSSLIERFFPEQPVAASKPVVGHPSAVDDEAGIIAAITAAVHQYRHKYPK